jgi:F-type H+-transporting ATPase subunit b
MMARTLGLGVFFWLGLVAPAAAAGGEGGGLISLDRSLIIQMVNFLLLLIVLSKLLYRPFVSKMEERTHAIKRALEEADAARAAAERERAEHAAKLQAAYAEAQGIRAQALKEAAEEQQRLVEGARREAARLVEAARREMEQDVRRARDTLRQEVAGLSIAVAERLIRRSLNEEDHRRIVADALAQMERAS